MTDKNEYAATVRAKGLDNTGVTQDVARRMHGTLERHTWGIVDLKHAARLEEGGTRRVYLTIEALEVAADDQTSGYLQELMRTLHQNRVLASEDAQLKIDTAADLAPKVEDVIARQRADQANKPHAFAPEEADKDGGTCWCGEDFDADVHVSPGAVPLEPAEEPEPNPDPAD